MSEEKKKSTKKMGRPVELGDVDSAEKVTMALSTPEVVEIEQEDPYDGLTSRQKMIARMRLRGLSQVDIAKVLKKSQPVISKEMKRIRKHMQDKGASIDQDRLIGETTTLFEEVEYKAWELYYTGDNGDKAKALSLVMQARERQTKLLMDLGRLERAGNKTTVEHILPPLVRDWDDTTKKLVVEKVVDTQLEALPEPEPPEDAEFEEINDDDDRDLPEKIEP